MQGQSERLSESEEVADALEYKWLTDTLVPLKNPVGEDIRYDKNRGEQFAETTDINQWLSDHVTGSSCYGYTNLVPAFCRDYIRKTKRKVLAVHIAKGSTVIVDWLPGSSGYEILLEKVLAAKKKAETATRVFFVWLQGESDAVAANTKKHYKAALSELCCSLQRDIGIEKFGIIRVGHFTNDARDKEIISAQDEICDENNDFIMLTSIATQLNQMPMYMNPFVAGHYSAAGLEKLGSAAGTALGSFVLCNPVV